MNAVGNAKVKAFGDLQNYNAVAPFTFEPQQLFVKGRDLFFKGFDLTVGNQIILWGVGDQFNPTNNLNANDLRDPLLFGKQQPNFMVKADYWARENLSFSAVLVPVFKPALLPASSGSARPTSSGCPSWTTASAAASSPSSATRPPA